MTISRAVIFGSGISGLLAAWACKRSGVDFDIYSDSAVAPQPAGFMYLHRSCDLPLVESTLKQYVVPAKIAKQEASRFYSVFVYGSEKVENSLAYAYDNPVVQIFSMQQAVEMLWRELGHMVKQCHFVSLREMIDVAKSYGFAFSTIPIDTVDKSQEYKCSTAYSLVESTVSTSNEVHYNGGLKYSLRYRWGSLFGSAFSEYLIPFEHPKLHKIRKVITAESLPMVPSNFFFAGRFGAWDKSILAHDVYYNTLKVING